MAGLSAPARDPEYPHPAHAPHPVPAGVADPVGIQAAKFRPPAAMPRPAWSRLRATLVVIAAMAAVVTPCAPSDSTTPAAAQVKVAHPSSAKPSTSGLGVRVTASLEALADGLLYERPAVVRVQSSDLAAIAGSGYPVRVLRAVMLSDSDRTAPAPVREATVDGADVALGASNAAQDRTSGTGSASGAGSGSQSSATVSRIVPLAVHTGFRINRLERRTVPIHASILPLERPG